LLEGLCIREPPTHLVSWFSDALLAQYKNLEMNSEDQPRRLKVGTFYPRAPIENPGGSLMAIQLSRPAVRCAIAVSHCAHTLVERRAAFSLVDAFALKVHSGNPAGVVQLVSLDDISRASMQHIATEINAPATAFIAPANDTESGVYDIRWFSSSVELPLCGHATFGGAKAILTAGLQKAGGTILFRSHMGAGNLAVRSSIHDDTLELSMDSMPPAPVSDLTQKLAEALGVNESHVSFVGRNQYDVLVELDSPVLVESLDPNQLLLNEITARGFIVTAAGSCDRAPSADFISRFFGPSMGIPEDPATGSAQVKVGHALYYTPYTHTLYTHTLYTIHSYIIHSYIHSCIIHSYTIHHTLIHYTLIHHQCALAPYWAARLGRREGLIGYQCSVRGGDMELGLSGDAGAEKVLLKSTAQVVVDGMVALPPIVTLPQKRLFTSAPPTASRCTTRLYDCPGPALAACDNFW
jgi:PhzF family phenazine biosynthesis protein